MKVVVSMLRGVNLGPHKRVKMEALRSLYESLGLRDPQTYVQSGNVLFRTSEKNLNAVAKRIEKAIESSFGFHADVILRTTSELREALAKNPFAARSGIDPAKLLVTFLASDPGEEAREKLRQIKAEPEELWIDGRELFIYFPNGLARPKLSIPLIERTLKTSGTGRNWNSVRKLLEMAEEMER
ncbi:MAG TPA: DUF1697 domain-containing protein [Bryobacteraceae bacterium]|nr:DUF1697 domain-containing protein [Bryobacteraceae bacterium]